MNKRIVKTIVETCMGLKRKDSLLVVTDDVLFRLASDFYKTARQIGVDAMFVSMPARKMHGEEPPKAVAEIMKTADAAILITSKSLSHTSARRIASMEHGVKIASLPNITKEIFNRSILIDYKKLHRDLSSYQAKIRKCKKIRVIAKGGTDISFSVVGRKWHIDNGLYGKKGVFGNLPAGELYIAPLEGTANGVIVVDGSAPLVGKLDKKVKMRVKDGYVKNMPIRKIYDKLKYIGKDAYNIAEFGIGFNPKAVVSGNTLEDEKAKKTIHIALGNNKNFGGKVSCPSHLDFVIRHPVIYGDGKRIK